MRHVLRIVLPLTALAAGVAVFSVLVSSKPQAKKKEHTDPGLLVEVLEAQPSRELVSVEANGTVKPARTVVISPEASGRVNWINSELEPGGMLAAGDVLVRLDARDYKLAVRQQYAQVDRARTELELEQGRKQIAEREWELMGEGEAAEGSLALRDPQLRTAKAALEAAESALEQAKLQVEKTVVKVPFNAWVQDKQVELGQLVGPQTPLATLIGTDRYWVEVSLPVGRLSWISIPGVAGATSGSEVRVWQTIDGQRIERTGRVVRLLGNLDSVGRMARVLVEVKDPFGLQAPGEGDGDGAPTIPFIVGSYVDVEIAGRELDGVFELPREAMREGDTVYVMTADDTLAIEEVEVVWKRRGTVLVAAGMDAGDRIVTSPVAAAIEGMKLRTPEMAAAAAAEATDESLAPEGHAAEDTESAEAP